MRLVDLIVSLLIIGIVGTLCLFLWLLTTIKEEIWGMIEEKEEDDDTRRCF